MNWSLPKSKNFPAILNARDTHMDFIFFFNVSSLRYLVHPAFGRGGCLLEKSPTEMFYLCFGGSVFLLGRAWHGRMPQILRAGDLKGLACICGHRGKEQQNK